MIRIAALPLLLLLAGAPARAQIEPQPEPAPPAPAPAAPVLTKAPELVEFAAAEYPPELLAQGLEGEALLLIDIDAEGHVDRVELVSATHPAFGEAALAAATRFVFTPAEIDGEPAAIRIEYRYGFAPEVPVPDAIAGETGDEVLAPVNFAGRVREAGSRRPLAGAVVELDGSPVAETDADGAFEARGVPAGEHTVRTRSRNHEPYTTSVTVSEGERVTVTYYLVRRSGDPFETVVRTRSERDEVSRVQLERQEVQRVPGTFGDPVRVIENLPGLARTPGGLGGALLVRGTPPEDSGVFIDGVEVPLLYHFGGLTSVVNAEFLENIAFHPGGFGARYGRATAGIVDVQSRDVECDQWRGSGEVSFMLASAFVCAPAGDWAVAAAGRRSYIDLVLPLALDAAQQEEDEGSITASPVYWDYQVKAGTRSGAHALDVFAFGSDDRLELIQTGSAESVNVDFGLHLSFHRLLLRHRWQLAPGVLLSSSLTPGYVRQGFSQRASELDYESELALGIFSVDWREELTYELAPWLTLRTGLDHQLGWASLETEAPFVTDLRVFPNPTFDYTRTQRLEVDIEGYEQGYWAEAVMQPREDLRIVAGLRVDRHDFHHTQALSWQPRATVRFEPLEGTTLKAAYGLYEKLPEPQYLIEGFGNPALDPERAHHFIAGFEQRLTDVVDLDVQAFYNVRQRLRSPSDDVRYEGGQAIWENWDNAGSGRAYGLEILLRHLATADGRFYGWVAYTLSRSLQRDRRLDASATFQGGEETEDDRRLEEYASSFDQTHILTVVGQWMLPWGLEAGFRFRLTSGNPVTPLDEGRVYFDADSDSYRVDLSGVERNSSRLPTFDQLDVRIDKNFTFALWRLAVFVEVLNAYNAGNVETYQYDYRYRERTPITLLPVVPVIGIRGEF